MTTVKMYTLNSMRWKNMQIFKNASILEAPEKNAAKNIQLTPARQLPRILTFVSCLYCEIGMSNISDAKVNLVSTEK